MLCPRCLCDNERCVALAPRPASSLRPHASCFFSTWPCPSRPLGVGPAVASTPPFLVPSSWRDEVADTPRSAEIFERGLDEEETVLVSRAKRGKWFLHVMVGDTSQLARSAPRQRRLETTSDGGRPRSRAKPSRFGNSVKTSLKTVRRCVNKMKTPCCAAGATNAKQRDFAAPHGLTPFSVTMTGACISRQSCMTRPI